MQLILVAQAALKADNGSRQSGVLMTRREKLIKRFLSRPKDFTWEELISLLSGLGFEEVSTGKTGGSKAAFY